MNSLISMRREKIRVDQIILAVPALSALVVYILTLAPGVVGLDSAELITGAHTLGVVHPTGYPLYLLIGKFFTLLPIRSIAYRVNLVSAVFGALTVWLTTQFIFQLLRRSWAAWLGAFSLAFAFGMWSMATVAEVYTLHTFFLMLNLNIGLMWLRKRDERWLFLMAFTFGLSLTNHISSIVFGLFILYALLNHYSLNQLWRISIKLLPFFLLGISVYAYLPVRDLSNPPLNYVKEYYGINLRTLEGVLWMVSGQAYRFFSFGYALPGYLSEIASFFQLLIRNFTWVGVFLGLIGLVTQLRLRRMIGIPLLGMFLCVVLFFAGYAVVDKQTMFLPAFALWSVWIAEGAMKVVSLSSERIRLFHREKEILMVMVKTGLIASFLIGVLFNWRYLNKSNAYGPEIFARQVLTTLPSDAMVIGKWSSAVVLEYFQEVEGMRPDVLIFNRSRFEVAEYYLLWDDQVPHDQAFREVMEKEEAYIERVAQNRSIFGAEYDPFLALKYEYQPMGNVFQLIPKAES